jgi:regulator of ribonuclease activity A
LRATTDLYDDHEDDVDTCSVLFRDFGGRRSFCGPVRTVKCRNDNSVLRELLNESGDGAVIVVDGDGSTERALLGDILAARGAANGWSGVVVYGVIRDSGQGTLDCPVEFGGVRFTPGSWVYCDEDGVLLSPTAID